MRRIYTVVHVRLLTDSDTVDRNEPCMSRARGSIILWIRKEESSGKALPLAWHAMVLGGMSDGSRRLGGRYTGKAA